MESSLKQNWYSWWVLIYEVNFKETWERWGRVGGCHYWALFLKMSCWPSQSQNKYILFSDFLICILVLGHWLINHYGILYLCRGPFQRHCHLAHAGQGDSITGKAGSSLSDLRVQKKKSGAYSQHTVVLFSSAIYPFFFCLSSFNYWHRLSVRVSYTLLVILYHE